MSEKNFDREFTDVVQKIIESLSPDMIGSLSDGYHSFNELYEHRHALFGTVCKLMMSSNNKPWKSTLHSDGTFYQGFFIAGVNLPDGMISYHIPLVHWNDFPAEEVDRAPEWDGHKPDDVVKRLVNSWKQSL